MTLLFKVVALTNRLTSQASSVRLYATNLTVKFDEFGDPLSVLRHEFCDIPKITPGNVLLKILASPVNPADINLIQGTYGFRPSLPNANAGLEGVGEVLEVGSGTSGRVKCGDWVLLPGNAWGTWRQFGLAQEKGLRVVSNKMDLVMASTFVVNPPTAYRMLQDFVQLKSGDTVIQNGANSGVGQAVIQIAHARNVRTVNIVRNRPDISELVNHLKSLGADFVITEEELRHPECKTIFQQIPHPRLALNCVGGKNCSDMMRHLADKAFVVTYGGMSKQPVSVSTTSLIFKDIRLVGFWRTRWAAENSGSSEDNLMYEELEQMALDGKLLPPAHRKHPLSDYLKAVKFSMQDFTSTKQILVHEKV